MVILIRCNDIVSDPRAMKYVRFLQEKGIEYVLIGWDRDGTKQSQPNTILWRKKAGFNVGGFHAVINRIGWMMFVFLQLLRYRQQKVTIHGCDLDSAFPAACYKLINRKAIVIFDIFDWFSATLHNQKAYILKAFEIMESFTIKHSNNIIICEPERIEQIPYSVNTSTISVFPNIPYFLDTSFVREDISKSFDNNLITFSYVGGFSKDRCLNEIITLAKNGIINLSIAGYGNHEIEEALSHLKECSTIKYYGKVSYKEGLIISYNSDVMYAMYSKTNPNHIYAAPNKYYEAMFLGKPIFTTKGTIVERKVLDNEIGYVSEESINDIQTTINAISFKSIKQFGEQAHKLWNEKYKNYTYDWLNNYYLKMIQ